VSRAAGHGWSMRLATDELTQRELPYSPPTLLEFTAGMASWARSRIGRTRFAQRSTGNMSRAGPQAPGMRREVPASGARPVKFQNTGKPAALTGGRGSSSRLAPFVELAGPFLSPRLGYGPRACCPLSIS
jgi:hypothetical protein